MGSMKTVTLFLLRGVILLLSGLTLACHIGKDIWYYYIEIEDL
jgi:hypothetical protein